MRERRYEVAYSEIENSEDGYGDDKPERSESPL